MPPRCGSNKGGSHLGGLRRAPALAAQGRKVVRIVLKDEVSSAERDAIIAPLLAHNAAQGVDFTNSPFALALEDDNDNVVGGVTGYSRWGWLYLASVAVPAELRGQG